jgi:DNA processing protein
MLYGIGDPGLLTPGLAIIGARRATPYGLKAATILASWSARQGLPVISGAALGCDQAAHRAALDADGPTVAVLGCAADVDYPVRASLLLDRVRNAGAVVSELPWGTSPKRWTFARRNRIIAGLARAVVVVEAGLPSGTFSTADHALATGRDVFAVPGSIFAPECRGSNRLIRQGAAPITGVDDLAQELGTGCTDPDTPQLGECKVLRAALADPARPDDLAHELGMSIVEVSRVLSRHERQGRLCRYRDGRYGPG